MAKIKIKTKKGARSRLFKSANEAVNRGLNYIYKF